MQALAKGDQAEQFPKESKHMPAVMEVRKERERDEAARGGEERQARTNQISILLVTWRVVTKYTHKQIH